MALLNYTTTVDVHKTIGEIQKILVTHGARKIIIDYDDQGRTSKLYFQVPSSDGIEKSIRLPANVSSVYELMLRQKKAGKIKTVVNYDQAERTAWRNIKDWVEAQMALLETEQAQFEEIFLPYMVSRRGQTFFEAYQQKLLE